MSTKGAWRAEQHQGVMVGEPHPRFHSLAEKVEWERHEAKAREPLTAREMREEEER